MAETYAFESSFSLFVDKFVEEETETAPDGSSCHFDNAFKPWFEM